MEEADKIVHELKEIHQFLKDQSSRMSGSDSAGNTPSPAVKSFDRGTEKIVAAINLLNLTIAKSANTTRERNENLNKLNQDLDKYLTKEEKRHQKKEQLAAAEAKAKQEATKQQEQATETNKTYTEQLKEQTKKIKDQNKGVKDHADAISERIRAEKSVVSQSQATWEAYKNAGDATDILKSKFFDLAGDSMGAQVTLRAFAAGLEGLKNFTLSYAKSIYAGERGNLALAKASTEAVKPLISLTDSIGNMLAIMSFFMPGGLIAKGLAFVGGFALKGMAKGAELAAEANEKYAEQTDKLFKTFNALSKAGVNTTGGLDGIFNQLQTLGMTMPQIEQFSQILASNTKHLRVFGGTMEGGAKQFATVAGQLYKSDIGKQFERAGIAAEEQADMTMNYLSLQARLGTLQKKNTEELIRSSAEFVKELDMAAELSGSTRKQQMEEREMAMADDRFRSALIDATNRNDQKEIARLQMYQKAAAMAGAAGDTKGRQGILHYAAGGPVTEGSVAAMRQYGLQTMGRGGISDSDIARHMARSSRQNERTFTGVSRYTGTIAGVQTDVASPADFSTRIEGLLEAARKEGFEGNLQDFLKTEQGKRLLGGDKKVAQTVDINRTQQAAGMYMDSAVNKLDFFADLQKSASETFARAVGEFSKTVGGKHPAGGVPGGLGTRTPVSSPAGNPGGVGSRAVWSSSEVSAAKEALKDPNLGSRDRAYYEDMLARQSSNEAPSAAILDFAGGVAGNPQNFEKLNSDLKQRILAAAKEYTTATGKKLKINSAHRTPEEQERVRAQVGDLAAPRGTKSMHEEGMAVDIDGSRDPMVQQALKRQGLHNVAVPGEPWHWQKFALGGIADRPSIFGEAGPEAAVPLPDGRSIPVTMNDNNMTKELLRAVRVLISKQDDMIEHLEETASHSKKLVRAAS
jgi:hypothetical protein